MESNNEALISNPIELKFEVVTVDHTGTINSREEKTAECYREDLGGGVHLDLVKIPGGWFRMGSPDNESGREDNEGPQHKVQVPDFYMGKYPVTQAQWRAVSLLDDVGRVLKLDPSRFKGDNRPVEQVSWYDAIEFCDRLSRHTGHEYRLPTEAEWEYACRAGTSTPFYFGKTITTDLANYCGNDLEEYGFSGSYGDGPKGGYREQTTDVGSFSPNIFGLYNMHGNVLEWCQDHWHDNYEGAPIDGSAWTEGGDDSRLVQRGGTWRAYPQFCRSASRYGVSPDNDFYLTGFRVVCRAPRTLQAKTSQPFYPWKGWSKVEDLVRPTFLPMDVLQHEPGGEVVFPVFFRGSWSDIAIKTALEDSEYLLPNRTLWLMHGVGSSTLIVYADAGHPYPFDEQLRAVKNVQRIMARTILVMYRALAVERGISIPKIRYGARIKPPASPPEILSAITATPSIWFNKPGFLLPDVESKGHPGKNGSWVKWLGNGWGGAIYSDRLVSHIGGYSLISDGPSSLWDYYTCAYDSEPDELVRTMQKLELAIPHTLPFFS